MTDSQEFAMKIARKAMPEMIQLRIAPTPENYAIWYAYTTGRNRELTKKIEEMKAAKVEFSSDIIQGLQNILIEGAASQQEIQRHSFTAQSLMSDLLDIIGKITGETDSYNKNLSGYLDQLSGKYSDQAVESMVKELVKKTIQIRESSGNLNDKLADSRKEIEELRESLVRITEEANRDPLTGLSNRKAFDNHLKILQSQAVGGDMEFTLLLIDIDHFKQFNDKYGHLVGDEVLKIVAREMMSAVKGRDIVARYGGEEFAVLLPSTPLGGALSVAEGLRKNIASHALTRKDKKETYGSLSVSIGVAQFHPEVDTAESLIHRADEALYRSKKGGRNRVTQESFIVEQT